MNYFFRVVKRIFGFEKNRNDKFRITDSFLDNESISKLPLGYLDLSEKLGLKTTGNCGICFKNIEIESFNDMKKYINDFLIKASDKNNTSLNLSFNSLIDDYGYMWFIIKSNSIEEIIAGINSIGDTVHEKGFSHQLLAAVFEFTDGYTNTEQNTNNQDKFSKSSTLNMQYLIYNYKLDKFYPFVPIRSQIKTDNKKRDHNQEIKIMDLLSNKIPFEKEMKLWYPIWNMPF